MPTGRYILRNIDKRIAALLEPGAVATRAELRDAINALAEQVNAMDYRIMALEGRVPAIPYPDLDGEDETP